MNQATRQIVRDRAGGRCEYCGILEQDDLVLPFHVEHIRAKKHGGSDDHSNLALACHHCNLHKGPNLSGVDPHTSLVVELFNPRLHSWSDHFEELEGQIIARTALARATIEVLAMNHSDRVELRKALK